MLFGIALDEDAIDVFAYKADGLFFEILWFCDAGCFPLRFNLLCGLSGCFHSPHLIEGVHIEGKVVEPALVVGNG